MNEENIRLARNVLYRTFVVGIVITALLVWATVGLWPTWTGLVGAWFHTDVAAMTPVVLKFFMNVRFFLIYIVLVPALGLQWTLCSIRCCKNKEAKCCGRDKPQSN